MGYEYAPLLHFIGPEIIPGTFKDYPNMMLITIENDAVLNLEKGTRNMNLNGRAEALLIKMHVLC